MDEGRVEAETANCSTLRLRHVQMVLGGGFSLDTVRMVAVRRNLNGISMIK